MNILDPYVDHFVFCEGVKTLSGMDKEMYFEKNADRYSKFKDKIIFTQIDEPSSKVLQEYGKKYRVRKESFMRDTYYKDSIKNLLEEHCEDDDIIIWSDLDEVPNPDVLKDLDSFYQNGIVYNFAQDNYQVCLNWFETTGTIVSQTQDTDYGEEGPRWIGTKMCNFGTLKKYSLTEMRRELPNEENHRIYPGGWHWSSVGNHTPGTMYDRALAKIKTSPHTELNNEKLLSELKSRIERGVSPLGQDNASYVDVLFNEDRFPEYLIENKEKYNYLIK